MTRVSVVNAGLICAACLMLVGCNARRVTIADTFPKGSYAAPWVLQGDVWSGSPTRAGESAGEEAEGWLGFEPERVWLAVYQHDSRGGYELAVRFWSFPSVERARQAYEHYRPNDADALEAGDEACWTGDGILVLWGRLVLDIFGRGPSVVGGPEQAVYLLAYFEKKMPAELPSDPR